MKSKRKSEVITVVQEKPYSGNYKKMYSNNLKKKEKKK